MANIDFNIEAPKEYDPILIAVEINRVMNKLAELLQNERAVPETKSISSTGSGDQQNKEIHYYRNDNGTITLVFSLFRENHKIDLTKIT